MSYNTFLLDEKGYDAQGVNVVCPICQQKKLIHVPQNMLKKDGLTTISIPREVVCNHHFQIFIDKNFKIRGYQKVDLELGNDLGTIKFNCQLCSAEIKFKPSDDTSYISMEPFKKFLGKELCAYKIAHYYKNELHVNTVLLEEHGGYNGILNSHIIQLKKHDNTADLDLKYFEYKEEHESVLESHPIYDFLIIFNTFEHWKYDLVCSPMFNSIDLTALAQKKMKEAMTIYSKIPKNMNIQIADKNFYLWILESIVICINLKDDSNIQWLKPLISEFMEKTIFEGNLISNCPRLLIINEVFKTSKITEEKLPLIRRLIFDDLLYSKIEIKYTDHITQILNKALSKFNLDRNFVLGFFFYQNKSIMEYLRKSEKFEDIEVFLEMIDFINRRKLLE
ncbi:MAG: hypothetical protein ACFFBP_18620 [Promethearchaeota archaeon]